MMRNQWMLLAAAMLAGSGWMAGHCDEGMWLYNRVPSEQWLSRHHFQPTQAWLDHVQKASVRLGGASAAFVSPEGLLLSNHHVGAGAIQKLSTPERNLMRDGFLAANRSRELPCPGVEARVLLEIEDVTARVAAAVTTGMTDQEAFEARRAAIAGIERDASQNGLVGDVVTLFQGAEYHLYVYKRYTDLRLVFAPEERIAAFGGDADNFEYPRFNLDACFFRAYENGQPAKTEHYLKWSSRGVTNQELVFVSGHPGRTDRLRTVAELRYQRDTEFPRSLARLKRIEVLLGAYALRDKENARRARGDLKSAENGRKAIDGRLEGLLDPELMRRKETAEAKLQAEAATLPELGDLGRAWNRIAEAQTAIARESLKHDLLESGTAFNSPLFSHARRLLRAADEKAKPDELRLEEYRSAALRSLELGLLAEAPIYNDLETIKLGDSLTHFAVSLGPEHPLVKQVLAGKPPRVRAGQLVRDTWLASAAERKRLYEGGETALQKTRDPMIELARMVDSEARRARRHVEVNREAIRQAQALIGNARYAILGPNQYPDATGTLRLSFGQVKGYEEAGRPIPPWTTLAGVFDRARAHDGQPPFDLPPSWISSRKKLNEQVPFNFVCSADITGGNSGSPVINRQGELVGLIFDSNLQGLVSDIEYTEVQGRAVAVDARGIIESLRKVYGARALVKELLEPIP